MFFGASFGVLSVADCVAEPVASLRVAHGYSLVNPMRSVIAGFAFTVASFELPVAFCMLLWAVAWAADRAVRECHDVTPCCSSRLSMSLWLNSSRRFIVTASRASRIESKRPTLKPRPLCLTLAAHFRDRLSQLTPSTPDALFEFAPRRCSECGGR